MDIIKVGFSSAEALAPLVVSFRAALRSYKGDHSAPDADEAASEIRGFIDAGFPVFAAEENGEYVGYIVCRIDEPCLWVEHIYVREEYRRRGAASALFAAAEETAREMGEETVFNYVHPNNYAMIAFLKSKGYTVLNMIEIRRPYKDEKLSEKINVGKSVFDY